MVQVLLRDPLDENVIPVVEELQRRLPPASLIPQVQGDGRENPSGQNEVEAGEEDGVFHFFSHHDIYLINKYVFFMSRLFHFLCNLSICFFHFLVLCIVNAESPFEFRALEVALEAICSFLAARTTELESAAYPALDELTSKVSTCAISFKSRKGLKKGLGKNIKFSQKN